MTRMKTSSLCLAVAAVVTLLFTGCKKEEAAPPGGKPGAAKGAVLTEPPLVSDCTPGTRGGRLVIATFGDPKTFNPITENESSSRDIIRLLFVSLVDFDWQSEQVKPGLAHAWSVEPDGKTWTFKLRKGVKWSDGQPLTADDVVFTWNDVIYNPHIINVTRDLFTIDGKIFAVSKVDDLTVRVVTPDIYAPFVEYFGGVAILPKHKLAQAVAEKKFESTYGINTPPEQLVGSGPYKLKQYKAGEFTLLERNPLYFVQDKTGTQLPYLDNLIYSVVPDMSAMSLRFLSGESDIHENVRPDEYERFKAGADSGKFKLESLGVGPERAFFWFNLNTNAAAQLQFSVDVPGAEVVVEKRKLQKLPDLKRVFMGALDVSLKAGAGPEQKKTITITPGAALPITVKFDGATLTIKDPANAATVVAKLLVDAKKMRWFANTKFRQAMQHAVDRPSIIKSIYASRAELAHGYNSPALKRWHNSAVPQYAYDPARARALLKEIGIEDRNGDGTLEDAQGNLIEFELNTNVGNNVREKVAIFVQSDLKKLGIKLNFRPVDFNALVTKIDDTFDYDCILLGLGGGGTDPASSLNVLKSDGFTHFWFPMQKRPATAWEARVDKLMNDQLKTLKFEERKALYDEVQSILSTELPFIYTVAQHNFAAYRADLGNVRPTVLSSYRVTWNAEELYLKKK
ncbi:MAG: ABC transporter substrate-binding protein [Limisphaerales bacterium]